MNQLQFTFPERGNWTKFKMIAVFDDVDGYKQTKRYSAEDIPLEKQGALASVITALAGLGEPWQASQVWARLVGIQVDEMTAINDEGQAVDLPVIREAIELVVEAISQKTDGRKVFTHRDYPESFLIDDENAVEFFKYFTK